MKVTSWSCYVFRSSSCSGEDMMVGCVMLYVTVLMVLDEIGHTWGLLYIHLTQQVLGEDTMMEVLRPI